MSDLAAVLGCKQQPHWQDTKGRHSCYLATWELQDFCGLIELFVYLCRPLRQMGRPYSYL